MPKANFSQIFIKFLIKAKQNTYAKSGEVGGKILADSSKEFIFKQGDFKYRDRYFGFSPFIGQEVVWYNNKAIWAMNYYGQMISNGISASRVYQFLKQALSNVQADKFFRGPDNFKRGDFKYLNNAQGIVEKFRGQERIFYKGKLVYELCYHGGAVASQ